MDFINSPSRHRKNISWCLVTLSFILLVNCTVKKNVEITATDSTETDVTPAPALEGEYEEGERERAHDIIQYSGTTDNDVRKAMETFSPFASVTALASASTRIKDSLWIAREYHEITNPEDSAAFRPAELKAYDALVAYENLMASGPQLKDKCPSLLDLTRNTSAEDSSFAFLPEAGKSKFLAHGNFFFLGGAPFLYKLTEDENVVYQDPQGNPETRFETDNTENGNYFLNSIQHFKSMPMTTTRMGPLSVREGIERAVNGVGSLVHTFETRVPALILTEGGLIPGHILSVRLKTEPQWMGCVSDQPLITFACSKSLEQNDILGVYIPYNSAAPTSCVIQRPNEYVWTADLNNDGIADIACVNSTFEGISSDRMAETLWFVNINGEWKILDWGQELDCT